MPFHNPGIGSNNPLTNSMYVQNEYGVLVSPGPPQYIITENGLKITTESGTPLITEG